MNTHKDILGMIATEAVENDGKPDLDARQCEPDPGSKRKWKLYHYGHPRAVFCSRACREGFKEDRKQGLCYGLYFIRSLNRFAMDIEEASSIERFCPYCNCREGSPKD